MKKQTGFIFIMALCLLSLGACTSKEETNDKAGQHMPPRPLGDVRQETASADVLPSFLQDFSEDMQHIYMSVVKHQDLLEHIPCYCGCEDTASHKNNYDCFVYKNNDDGSIIWDDHATKCPICLDIAIESIVMYGEGKSMKDIQNHIDVKYKNDSEFKLHE